MESYGIFFFREAGLLRERGDGFEALGAITRGMGRTGSFAAVLSGQTMAAGGIGFADLSLGQTMETEKEMVEALIEIILRAADECVDVIRIVEVRRLDLDAHGWRDVCRNFFNAFDGGFEAGHCIMRK